MLREFFVPRWLERHLVVYAGSHMLVTPLAMLWMAQLGAGDAPLDRAVWAYAAMSFLFGFCFEIARKMKAPAEERDGVDHLHEPLRRLPGGAHRRRAVVGVDRGARARARALRRAGGLAVAVGGRGGAGAARAVRAGAAGAPPDAGGGEAARRRWSGCRCCAANVALATVLLRAGRLAVIAAAHAHGRRGSCSASETLAAGEARVGGKALGLGTPGRRRRARARLLRRARRRLRRRARRRPAQTAMLRAATLAELLAPGDARAVDGSRPRPRRCRLAVRALRLPRGVARELEDTLGALGAGPYAVRSSMVGEDSATRSFAGQLDSFLHQRAEDVAGARSSAAGPPRSARARSPISCRAPARVPRCRASPWSCSA